MAIDFSITSTISSRGRKTFSAQRINSTEPKFVIGRTTSYEGNFGLFNTSVTMGVVYNPEDYVSEFGFWAYFIYPTAMFESSGSFKCLNPYDRAFSNLCTIGNTNYQSTINTVRNTIKKLTDLGKFSMKYNANTGEFAKI